jgi:undecaprenyl-diphosphatase
MSYDLAIFTFIYGLSGKSGVIDAMGIFFADYFPYILGLWLLSLLFFKKFRVMASLAIFSALSTELVKGVIVLFYQRPRPYMVLPGVSKLIWLPWADNFQSFPSGHALFFFAAGTMVYLFNKKWGALFFASSVVVGLARVFVGVHWPSDILGGALLGALTSFIIYQFYLRYKKKYDQQR